MQLFWAWSGIILWFSVCLPSPPQIFVWNPESLRQQGNSCITTWLLWYSVYGAFTMETIVATSFGRVIDIQKGQSDELTVAANEIITGLQDKNGSNYLFLTMIISENRALNVLYNWCIIGAGNFPWLEAILRYYVNHSGNAFIKAFQVLNEVSELLIEDRRKECKRKANTVFFVFPPPPTL